jgi:hypothetical protein
LASSFAAAAACSRPCSLGALALLALDLVLEQGDLAGELAVGVVGLVGLGLGVADAAFDDGLVDGVGLGCLFGQKAEPDEQAFEASLPWLTFRPDDGSRDFRSHEPGD